uniref:Uncharacterized protein n=1 Tax=Heterorhabditis bacteriophora TaxID=37862 RepID=A0A1I7XAL5_HETBA
MATAAESDVHALEKLKDIYGDLAQVLIPTAGRINCSGKLIEVTSIWDNRALAMKKFTKTQRLSVVERSTEGYDYRLLTTSSLPMTNFEYVMYIHFI